LEEVRFPELMDEDGRRLRVIRLLCALRLPGRSLHPEASGNQQPQYKGNDARTANTGNGQGSAQQSPAASPQPVPAAASNGVPVQEPLPTKPSSWWRLFVFGGGLIPRGDAIQGLRVILSELQIAVDGRLLDFQTEQVAKSTFCQVLEKLSGSDLGWRQLCQIYERQQARERLWADH
jgi:hypothetical protein